MLKGMKLIIKQGSKNGKDWHLLLATVDIHGIEFPVVKEFVYGKGLQTLKDNGVVVEKVKTKA